MEVFALNEQLREEFAGVVKHFLTIRREEIARVAAITASVNNAATAEPPPGDPSLPVTSPTASPKSSQVENTSTSGDVVPPVSAPTKPQLSPGSVLPERTQQYATLAKAILAKVNMYQYSSREQFARDIAALLELADSNDQKLLLQQLVDQQHALAVDTKSSGRPKKRPKVNGIRIDSAAIPGIQQLPTGKWACNLDMHGNTSITSKWNAYERALEKGYKVEIRDEFRRLPHGEQVLKGMSRELAASCAKFDREILQDAVDQVKQRLPIAKHHDVSSLTAALAPQPATPVPTAPSQPTPTPPPAIAKEKEANPTRKRELVIDTTVPKTTPNPSTPGITITPAAAAPDLVAKRTPTGKSSRVRFLRLRRIIQIRLCRHLEGREICARLNEPGHDESWVATGRLERGKVYAYNTKKYASFSDFVQATLKRSVAACEHIYLLDTRENIDAHLLVCDQFSDEFRQRLDDENFKEVSELYKQGKHS